MAEEVIGSMETDWAAVADAMTNTAPDDAPLWYQKQMAHHMVGPVAPDDLRGVTHAFLIRDPARMAASYAKKRERVTARDLGLRVQRQFFDRECDRIGKAPPVIDGADVLADPSGKLEQLCHALGISWDPAMMHWAAGRHPADGVWGAHWYGRVERSTGFEPPETQAAPEMTRELRDVADACLDDYHHLKSFAL